MINKVEICGVNTSKLPVLSNEKKKELLLKIKEGNEAARQEFVNGNLRLVLSVIQRFTNRGENIDDLFQIGCIGLIKAVYNYLINKKSYNITNPANGVETFTETPCITSPFNL